LEQHGESEKMPRVSGAPRRSDEMFVLDSDHLSLIDRSESELGARIRRRIQDVGPAHFATTIVNYDEQTRGWLAFSAKAKRNAELIEAYRRLEKHLHMYCATRVLSFDELAAVRFQALQSSKLKVGTMDLRIAAIVLAQDATLLSRNLRDFQRVPGLRVEDWTNKITEAEPL
jgi:tRNA(fMet)-specific endonuclease VapC